MWWDKPCCTCPCKSTGNTHVCNARIECRQFSVANPTEPVTSRLCRQQLASMTARTAVLSLKGNGEGFMTESSRNLNRHFCGVRLALMVVIAMIVFTFATPARAQFICAGSADGSTGLGPQGASATDIRAVACGSSANASGTSGGNAAFGFNANADAHGDGSVNAATGASANAGGNASTNTANGASANASGASSANTASGSFADA